MAEEPARRTDPAALDPPLRRAGPVAAVLLSLIVLAQIASWMVVCGRDRTPLVEDSAELYLFALQRLNGWTVDAAGRPPLGHHVLAVWMALVGRGRLAPLVWALLVYVALVGLSWAAGEALCAGAGPLAAALCAGLPGMVGAARYLVPDQLPAALLAAAALARARPTLACGLAASAVLVKLSAALYLAPLLPVALARPQWRRATLLAGAPVLAWLLLAGEEVVRFYAVQPDWQQLDRSLGIARWSASYVLYYPRVLGSWMIGPWMGLPLLAGLVFAARERAARLGLGYALAVVALHTLAPTRTPRYLLPLLPLLAALSALGWGRAVRRPASRLALAATFGVAGAVWSAGLLAWPGWATRYAPVGLYHRAGALDAEDLASIGLFVPLEARWGGEELAEAIAALPDTQGNPILAIGCRPFVRWDLRLRLAERRMALPWLDWRVADGRPEVLRDADFVLLSDYSPHERDLIRHNLEPYTEAELERRGHRAEERLRRWFDGQHARYERLLERATRDGRRVTLYRRR